MKQGIPKCREGFRPSAQQGAKSLHSLSNSAVFVCDCVWGAVYVARQLAPLLGRCVGEMAVNHVVPAAVQYQTEMARNIAALEAVGYQRESCERQVQPHGPHVSLRSLAGCLCRCSPPLFTTFVTPLLVSDPMLAFPPSLPHVASCFPRACSPLPPYALPLVVPSCCLLDVRLNIDNDSRLLFCCKGSWRQPGFRSIVSSGAVDSGDLALHAMFRGHAVRYGTS